MNANPGIGESGGTVRIHLGGLGACCRKFLRFLCHKRASEADARLQIKQSNGLSWIK